MKCVHPVIRCMFSAVSSKSNIWCEKELALHYVMKICLMFLFNLFFFKLICLLNLIWACSSTEEILVFPRTTYIVENCIKSSFFTGELLFLTSSFWVKRSFHPPPNGLPNAQEIFSTDVIQKEGT